MKTLLIISVLLLVCLSPKAQYYLRGEIRDDSNNPLANVKIQLHSSGYLYYSGSMGGFGITLPSPMDSLTISADGFYGTCLAVNADKYQKIVLKPRFAPAPKPENRLMSLTKNLSADELSTWTVASETYSSLVENEFLPTARYPETGFAINVNKASYSNIRRFLNMNNFVPPDAIRIEEMLNYFHYNYQAPGQDSMFSVRSALSSCPWSINNQLLFLQVCAKKADMDSIPPANLVFLIDVSGSMDLPNRLPLLKSAFSLMVNNLRPQDTVSIVVYGGTNGVWLTPTSGGEKKKILESIAQLEAGGATPGESGIRAAYRLAKSQYIKGGTNRVILATDGDFNVGERSEDELNRLISSYRSSDIYLTCLGVGMGNYKDSKLEVLANRGKGNFAYLDNEKEAEKVLMEEFAQTIYAVAKDAYIDLSFDQNQVKSYRLIGFENKLNALADTSNVLQGGEIGSGHTLMALVEIEPNHPADSGRITGPLAEMNLHYQLPHTDSSIAEHYALTEQPARFDSLSRAYRFSSSVALFGTMLKNSSYAGKTSWEDLIKMSLACYDPADVSQAEFIKLLDQAKKIYHKAKKKKPTQTEY
ncbi:MAG TPA: von Willebrand factor type A domain-containing protein [Puia sp.]|nr:von Willebrand factor type A domain-containing protein [Puia sp.]